MPEIRRYVLGVFGRNTARLLLGQQLMKEIESKRSSLFPIIQQPLMLALACRVFSETNQKIFRHELPVNPAELVEQALSNIFDRRDIEGKDHDQWLDALSTLAAFTLTESGDSMSLSASREYAKRLLRENPTLRLTKDGEAQTLLNQLAPACGVLAFENGQYTFTNRVLAEFLAARWIVRLGYPNWPYQARGDGSINSEKPYTTLGQERERQIMDFLGDHVWTIKRNGLLQAVHFELGRTPWGSGILVRHAHWIHEQIKPFYSGKKSDLDIQRTLVLRIFHCVQACLMLSAEDEASVHSLLKRLFDGTNGWHIEEFWASVIALVPSRYSDPYLEQSLEATASMGRRDGVLISLVANVIATGWPGNDRAFTSLEAALAIAREEPKEKSPAIHLLVSAMASGWPGNDRALASLDAVLTIARDRPKENEIAIGVLAWVIGTQWPGNDRAFASLDAALMIARERPKECATAICDLARAMTSGWPGNDQAFASLNGALAIARERPEECPNTIWGVAHAMASGWPGNDQAFASLDVALTIARKKPKENGNAIRFLALSIAYGWPRNDRAFTSIDAALTIARERPNENHEAIGHLAKAMARGWRGNDRAFASLDAALTIAREQPKENECAISYLAAAMGSGWPGNDRAFTCVDEALTLAKEKPKESCHAIGRLAEAMALGWPGNDRAFISVDAALTIARDKPKENAGTIAYLVDALAKGWPGNDRAITSVATALAIARNKPKTNTSTIEHLASAMASGWPRNDRAIASLDAALAIARNRPKTNTSAIEHLASAMASGWPGNDRAFASLDAALMIAREKPTENRRVIQALAKALTSGWPGQPKAACGVTAAGEVKQLNIEQWRPWVTVFADEAAIKNWCGEGGEKWGLEGDPEFAIVPIPAMPGENGKPKAILIAPRERIRRGLDPELLSTTTNLSADVQHDVTASELGLTADIVAKSELIHVDPLELEILVANAMREKKIADAEKAWDAVAEKDKTLFAAILKIIDDHADSGPLTDGGVTIQLKKNGICNWHRSTINKRIITLHKLGLISRPPHGGLKLTDLGVHLVGSWQSASS